MNSLDIQYVKAVATDDNIQLVTEKNFKHKVRDTESLAEL